MSYTALYRKFRPQRFEDVKGQDHIVTTLRNQIRSDRIQHAYLFCGTRGTGKTSVAKLFARAINCEHPDNGNPCMECDMCKAIMSQSSLNVIEIDAASNNGVDNIRQIIDEVSYPPTQGRFKVYIIDEVHMLSAGAFNALLKTLEEPPSYVVFILATTEVHKLPVTILSRCQRYDFKRISVDDITLRINELLPVEGIEAEDAAIRYIAKCADGALRDALSLLDQCVAFNFGQKLTYEMVLDTLGAVDLKIFSKLLRMIICADVSGAIKALDEIIMGGRDLTQLVTDFTWYLRNLLLAVTSDDISSVVDMSAENLENLLAEAAQIDEETAMRYIRILSELSNQIRYAYNKRVLTELAIIKMCMPESESREDTLISRIRTLENKLDNGEVSVRHVGAQKNEADIKKPELSEEAVKELRESLPEDIKNVVSHWKDVVNRLQFAERVHLSKAAVSYGDSGDLIIAFEKPSHKSYYTEGAGCENHLHTIEEAVNAVAGAKVRLTLALQKQADSGEGVDYINLRELFPTANVVVEDED